MSSIKFLSPEVIQYFHGLLIQRYGGSAGLRDKGWLESALAQTQQTMDGQYLHRDIFEMAAAYGFHLCQNHPFADGNKRIALVAMDTFLQLNGLELLAGEKETYVIMLRLATGGLSKQELTQWLKEHVEAR